MSLGENLRIRRMELNLTQKDLAEATGLSQPFINMVERGTRSLRMESGDLVAKTLGCTMEDLLYGTYKKPPAPNEQT